MFKRTRLEEGWTTLFLVWAMIFIAASAIAQSDLIEGLGIIPFVATVALFAGLVLAKSRFPSNTAHLFSLIYGLFIIFFFLGLSFPDTIPWRERIFDIVARQIAWFRKAFEGGTSRDGLIFVVHTSVIFWLLGYTAAWYTFRYPRVWRVVVPAGIVLLSVVYYYNGPSPLSIYLALYTLLSLIYIARTYLVDRERVWRAERVRYERSIWFSFLRAAFLAALVALLAARIVPPFTASAAVADAFSGANGPWKEFQNDWTRLFSSLRSYSTATSDPYLNSLTLGGPRTVGNTPIMDVTVPRKLPYVYWQAIVYDTYEDGSWDIEEDTDTLLLYPEDGVLTTPFSQAREVITQTVVNYLPNSSFIYAAPEVIGVDRQAFVDSTPDGQGGVVVTSLRSRYVLRLNDEYLVTSRVSTADAESLRQASTVYPSWVTTRYLQVPDTITPETLALAQEITTPYDTPFDKAIAVRDWLRQNVTYNDQIAAPPEGIDAVHYVLFVAQEGYCNYYASAMALMLRSQGIPARVVSGYAQGEFNEDTMSYRVKASNAHTWVEVYFPLYGWIQFEPTAALPTVDRPESAGGNPGDAFGGETFAERPDIDRESLLGEEELGTDAANEPLPDLDQFGTDQADGANTGLLATVSLWQVVGAIVVVGVAAFLMLSANEMNKRVERDVVGSYSRLSWWARWLGILFRPAQTPYERADVMVTAVPEGSSPIRRLTQHFVVNQFSAHPNGDADTESQWRQLRPLLLRKTIVHQLDRLRTWRVTRKEK
ncbi:MAG: hypothetical protein H6662_04850 [Ardenticatenaceae bacterium]|nr:hypothetical protein [Anaerolineales bacterium]MCB8920894.1 hypothetical protein [Ardenticatenaceae bacterium]